MDFFLGMLAGAALMFGYVEYRRYNPSSNTVKFKEMFSSNGKSTLEKLRDDLNLAVENNQFEKAAELRDKIKKISRKKA